MLRHFGARVEVAPRRRRPRHHPPGPAGAARHRHRGADRPSSAAFPLVAALITPGSDVVIEGVMMNPLRTGPHHDPDRDGRLHRAPERARRGRRDGRGPARPAHRLTGVTVPAARAPAMIDEYPILAVAASFAQGTTRMRGLHELRVKESDRLAAVAAGLAEAASRTKSKATTSSSTARAAGFAAAGGRWRPISTTASPCRSW